MRHLSFALVLCLAAAGALAQGGQAPSGNRSGDIEAVLRGFGLTGGPWSADCSQPESPNNWYGRFEVRNGRVTQIYSNRQSENRYEILDVTKLSDERLRVRVRLSNPGGEDIQTLEWVVRGGRVRTFSNISEKRGPVVVNGKVGDSDTPWVSRCR